MKQDNNDIQKRKYIWVLLFIFVVTLGFFLRTYNFTEWLRFNADQARDATVVRSMVEKHEVPLLGPVAGGTNFRIGPMSIYFQFIGAWLFGTFPDKMAYADLFFGILSVPLIFLLLKEYFSRAIGLLGAALYAGSFFAIQYSRFAWNSNSAQFFVLLLLYAIIKLSYEKSWAKILWVIVSGLSLGVLVQLHTLLLFASPLFIIIIGVHFVKNKKVGVVHVLFVIIVALLVNFPQILNEVRTDQGNITAFYDGLMKKSTKQDTLGGNVLHVVACQMEANAKILLPEIENENCNFPFTWDNLKKLNKRNETFVAWIEYGVKFVFVVVFSVFGYCILVARAFKAKEESARIFFAVIFAYCVSLLLVSFPFGSEISLRYFILTAFVPYLFVALFFDLFMKKYGRKKLIFPVILVSIIFVYNIYFCVQIFDGYRNSSGNMINGSMKQAEQIAEYLINQEPASSTIQIGGRSTDIGRFVDRMSYFSGKTGKSIVEVDDQKDIDSALPFFVVVSEMSKKCEPGRQYKEYGTIRECKIIGDVTIMKIN